MSQNEKPSRPPALGRDLIYVQDGMVFPGKIVHVDVPNYAYVNLIYWDPLGQQHFRHSVPYSSVPNNKTWHWQEVPQVTVDMLRRQGDEMRKHILSQAEKLVAEGKMSDEQFAVLLKRMEPSKNPPIDRPRDKQ